MDTSQQPPAEKDLAADQGATPQQEPAINGHINDKTVDSSSKQEEPLPQADGRNVELLADVDTSQPDNTQDTAEPMQTDKE